ncbi:transposase [Polyangium jinanense]|uniref:IS110 family transposase n=1 Tax=Polyangium jinanense TaxID=2829994 RepID=UPI002428CF5B|nr:transposase [Polyangium jinanense]
MAGVDTHKDTHIVVALDATGESSATRRFPAATIGYAALAGWLRGLRTLDRVGIEGTGSYRAGLTWYLREQGINLVEVNPASSANSPMPLQVRPGRRGRSRARYALGRRAGAAKVSGWLGRGDAPPTAGAACGHRRSHPGRQPGESSGGGLALVVREG